MRLVEGASEQVAKASVKNYISQYDKDRDGELDLDELIDSLQKNQDLDEQAQAKESIRILFA